MAADHHDLKRSLCILRRLLNSPADKYTLAEFVELEISDGFYGDVASGTGKKRIENDIERLRQWGCDIQHYEKEYHLESYGEFSPVGLGEAELNTLAFLQEAFAPGAPQSANVQQLLAKIADWLPETQRDSVPLRQKRFRLNFRQHEAATLDVRVENAIQKALKEGRLLRFGYRSPRRSDDIIPIHTVQPWGLFFDTTRGHQYLEAYWLTSHSSLGETSQQKWMKFRPESIVATQIEVLPDKRPPTPPKRAKHKLEYWLSPRIVRHGHVTRHFDNMQTHETNAEGWLRVTATTDDLFSAVQILLTYGDQCMVTGGSEARKDVERLVKGMAGLYEEGIGQNSDRVQG